MFLKTSGDRVSPAMCLFHPFTDVPRISDMVTLGNKTAAAPLVLSKHRFCWGQLSPAAARPPGSPPIVSQRRRSQDSGGTGWLCGHYPETLCLRWYSAEKDTKKFTYTSLHLEYLTPPRLNFCTQTWLHETIKSEAPNREQKNGQFLAFTLCSMIWWSVLIFLF